MQDSSPSQLSAAGCYRFSTLSWEKMLVELVDSLLVPDPAPGSSQYPSNTQEGASFLRTDQWRPLRISRTGAP